MIRLSFSDRDVGGRPLLDQLLTDPTLTANAKAKQGLDEMTTLFTFLDAYKITEKVILSSWFK
jgi:histidyl-tRNA synthetase